VEETEHWLPVVGYEGFYEVSDLGRVRSVPHRDGQGRFHQGRIRRPQWSGQGKYQALFLSMNGVLKQRYVHALVLEAFVGPAPGGMECLHGDDDKTNNRLENLTWGTHAQNQKDASIRGRSAAGERNGGAVLTVELVREIRSALEAGVQGIALADYHGVSRATISRVKNHRLWTN
jgi:hypothetical protein